MLRTILSNQELIMKALKIEVPVKKEAAKKESKKPAAKKAVNKPVGKQAVKGTTKK